MRNFWTLGLVWHAVGMAATFWVRSVEGAMTLVAFLGVSWAVACWVPFALVMEAIREIPSLPPTPAAEEPRPSLDSQPKPFSNSQPFRTSLSRQQSATFQLPRSERSPLLLQGRPRLLPRPSVRDNRPAPASGGTILGIHNLAIVAPQFLVALIAAVIFEVVGKVKEGKTGGEDDGGLKGSNDVVWVLRFGGLAALGELACAVPGKGFLADDWFCSWSACESVGAQSGQRDRLPGGASQAGGGRGDVKPLGRTTMSLKFEAISIAVVNLGT